MFARLAFVTSLLLWSGASHAIIGGADVSDSDSLAKSVVALQMTSGREIYHGSGFLIGRRVVMTAAHNVTQADSVDVIFATHPIYGPTHGKQRSAHALKIFAHPDYGPIPFGIQNDIALILLDRDAQSRFTPRMRFTNTRLASRRASSWMFEFTSRGFVKRSL